MSVDLNKAPAWHLHVGSNVPGYSPMNEPYCFDSIDDAVEYLRHEISDLQDSFWESCHNGTGWDCPCEWCELASDCEAILGSIADGDVAYAVKSGHGRMYTFATPEGPNLVHWLKFGIGHRSKCELSHDDGCDIDCTICAPYADEGCTCDHIKAQYDPNYRQCNFCNSLEARRV
jgi:hypothetical protein